jgi:hypothetical protein
MLESQHLLTGARVLAALGLLGPLALGVAIMTIALPHLNLLFWLGFLVSLIGPLGTLWVGYDEIRNWSAAGWLMAFFVVIEIIIPTSIVAYASGQDPEDTRVSFQFAAVEPNKMDVTFLFRNLGMQAAIVSDVGLYEIAQTIRGADQEDEDNADVCDSTDQKSLHTVWIAESMMGKGAQVGNDKRADAAYSPIAVTVDGIPWKPRSPIAIDGGKTKTIQAQFEINSDHTKKLPALVLCPFIATIDISNSGAISICRGWSQTIRGNSFFNFISGQQFHILPHSRGASCPISGP